MENKARPGYFTEKIVNAALANAVPIYWGAQDMADYINPKAFIHCKFPAPKLQMPRWCAVRNVELKGEAFRKCNEKNERLIAALAAEMKTSAHDCIQQVLELEKDDAKYKAMLREPFLRGNELSGVWDWAGYGRKIRQFMNVADSWDRAAGWNE